MFAYTDTEQNSMNSISDQDSTMSETSSTLREINAYITKRNADKKNLEDKFSKQDLVDIIFKQNDLLSQQSSQMIEIVNMANVIEESSRLDEAKKCDAVKDKYNNCAKVAVLQKHHMKAYVHSIKMQIVLFILFLIMLMWLLYIYLSEPSTSYPYPSPSPQNVVYK